MKKFLSVLMSLTMIMSTAAAGFTASAGEIEESEQISGIEISTPESESNVSKGTFKFDSGDWQSSKLCFYIWDNTTGLFATKNGWRSDQPWGSVKLLGGTAVEGEEGVFESYEVELVDSHECYVIFHDPELGQQTMECCLDSSAFGLTAKRTGIILENPVDERKTIEDVRFSNGLGTPILLTSSGKIQGTTVPKGNLPQKVASYVYKWINRKNKEGNDVITESNIAELIEIYGTTPDDVWAEFLAFDDIDDIKEKAKAIIKPTREDVTKTTSDWEYEVLDDGTVSITRYTGSEAQVTIPSEIDGKTVTAIGYGAFYRYSSLTNVTIPDSVITIGDSAFADCSSLESVTIPNSVTAIGIYAFDSCTSLASVTIGNTVTTIGNSAFINCSSLVSVTIPDSVTTIGNSTFSNCESLTSITIPDSVTNIGEQAFESCTSLTSVTIPRFGNEYRLQDF